MLNEEEQPEVNLMNDPTEALKFRARMAKDPEVMKYYNYYKVRPSDTFAKWARELVMDMDSDHRRAEKDVLRLFADESLMKQRENEEEEEEDGDPEENLRWQMSRPYMPYYVMFNLEPGLPGHPEKKLKVHEGRKGRVPYHIVAKIPRYRKMLEAREIEKETERRERIQRRVERGEIPNPVPDPDTPCLGMDDFGIEDDPMELLMDELDPPFPVKDFYPIYEDKEIEWISG